MTTHRPRGRAVGYLDRAIDALFPKWGQRRRAVRIRSQLMEQHADRVSERLKRSFDGADGGSNRVYQWLRSGLSPDAGLEKDLMELQHRCSELYRNSGIAHGAIEGRVSHEIGIGISPQARVRDGQGVSPSQAKEINDSIERNWKWFSETGVDKRRRMSLYAFERLVARSYASHGEAFVLLSMGQYRGPVGLQVEAIAPERVETPPGMRADPLVRLGIRFSGDGNILGYYVRRTHPGEQGVHAQDSVKYDYYDRYDDDGQPRMLHVYDEIFPGQSRGIPWLASAMTRIRDLEDFLEAELVAKQIEACFGVIIKKGAGSVTPHQSAENLASEIDSSGNRFEDLQPGMVQYLSSEDEVVTLDPTRPGGSFAPYVEHNLRMIAASLNYPYELLAKNFFRTTFSSGQLAMLDGRIGFAMRAQTIKEQLLIPLYKRFLFELVFVNEVDGLIDLIDYRRDPKKYERHEWQSQGLGFINPTDERKADQMGLADRVLTRTEVCQKSGGDWDQKMDQRKREEMRLIEDEVEIRKFRMELESQAGLPATESENEGDDREEDRQRQPAEVE